MYHFSGMEKFQDSPTRKTGGELRFAKKMPKTRRLAFCSRDPASGVLTSKSDASDGSDRAHG